MTAPDKTEGKISTVSRVLAWIFLVFIMLGIASWALLFFKYGQPIDPAIALLTALVFMVMLPLIWSVAVKGRSPRWLSSIETMYDREAQRRGIPVGGTRSGRGVMFVVTTVVFGALLIALGQWLGLFEGQTGWFAAAVFFVAWLIVVLVLWRNLRQRTD